MSGWHGEDDTASAVKMPIIDGLSPRPKSLPLAIPKDLQDRLEGFHSDPIIWWLGKLTAYVMRYTDGVKAAMEERFKAIGFQRPIVG